MKSSSFAKGAAAASSGDVSSTLSVENVVAQLINFVDYYFEKTSLSNDKIKNSLNSTLFAIRGFLSNPDKDESRLTGVITNIQSAFASYIFATNQQAAKWMRTPGKREAIRDEYEKSLRTDGERSKYPKAFLTDLKNTLDEIQSQKHAEGSITSAPTTKRQEAIARYIANENQKKHKAKVSTQVTSYHHLRRYSSVFPSNSYHYTAQRRASNWEGIGSFGDRAHYKRSLA